MSEQFDLAVIGGGPGGYVCAIRAAQLGLKTVCIEKRDALGGTCLNIGCIPSKALLHASHMYEEARHGTAALGIDVKDVSLNLPTMMAHKDKVVADNTQGIDFLFKKNKIMRVTGTGRIEAANTIEVSGEQPQTILAKNIVIAAGSDTLPLPGVDIDEQTIVSSTGALQLTAPPEKMLVVGAGVIGLELGSVWRRLGSEVTVIEYQDFILPPMDGEIRKQSQRILAKQGLAFKLGTKVAGIKKTGSGVTLIAEPAHGGEAEELVADVALISIGRRPYTDALGLDAIGIATDARGFIPVDSDYQTSVQGVFAIGDVIGGAMLAHKAEEEGVAVAELIAGQSGHVNYDAIPSVVYTTPEIAMVGKTEEQLKKANIAYAVGKFPFSANGRARANNAAEGFVKVLADAKTDRILGCHIIGPAAGDIIQEVVVAMEFGACAEDVFRSSHGHPQFGEAIKEAMLAVHKRPLHI